MTDREIELFRDCLRFDLYLRENWKSQSDFAKDMERHKEEKKAFYKTEAMRHQYLPAYTQWDGKQLARLTQLEYFRSQSIDGNGTGDIFLI